MFVQGKITGRMHGALSRDFEALQGLVDLKDCVSQMLSKTCSQINCAPF